MKSPSIISQLLVKIQKQRVIYVFDCSVSGEVLKSTVKFRKEVLGSSGVERSWIHYRKQSLYRYHNPQ